MIFWIGFTLATCAISYVAVAQIRGFVIRSNILDIPNDRSSHSIPTPRGGGAAISAVILVGLMAYTLAFSSANFSELIWFLLGGTLITVVGWIDDVRSLSARLRFGVQFLAAALVIYGIGPFDLIQVPASEVLSLGPWGYLVAFIWLVGLTNAYNFMDGIDGLAGGQAAVAGFGWALVGGWLGQPLLIAWGCLILGASLGFLGHNWSPASIFMGDVGSAFLGFTFAVIPIWVVNSGPESTPGAYLPLALVAGATLVWPFLLDTTLTFVRRLLKGENVLAAHRSHLYQWLVIADWPHSIVSTVYIGLGLTGIPLMGLAIHPNLEFQIGYWLGLMVMGAGLVGFSWYEWSAYQNRIAAHNSDSPLKLSQISSKIRNRHLLLTDLFAIGGMVYLSYVLRFERLWISSEHQYGIALFLAFLLVATPLSFWAFGIYSRFWRYASLSDLASFGVALLLADIFSLMGAATIIWYGRLESFVLPRSIPIIFFVLALIGLALPRLGMRILHRQFGRDRRRRDPKPVAIMGAGDAGEMLLREIKRDRRSRLEVRAFLDDDPSKHGMQIHGIPVIGGREAMERLPLKLGVNRLIIAMPSVNGATIRELVRVADEVGIDSKIIPSVNELLYDTGLVKQIRDVAIEDLLRRSPIQTDVTAVRTLVTGKRILITGGGGSIGSELCRQLIRCEPSEMILLGHGENSIFGIHNELRKMGTDTDLYPVIADVRFPERILQVFRSYQPDIVFHAAAHKHVPLMEMNPVEAITNNVYGTRNLLEAALDVDVDQFVMISTDKAVNPTNIMGASKRTAEMLVHQAAKRSQKPYVAVRFGNVLGSRGSVVLTFKDQIAKGGPVTVTHPEMTRFFMTIPEAVQLVLQAAVLGTGGEVFVLDMGQPVKIVDLAKDLIRLSGLELGRDIDIEFVGIRPGEKLYEELFIEGEDYNRTKHDKIFLAANASSLVRESANIEISQLIELAHKGEVEQMMSLLRQIVPEYLTKSESAEVKPQPEKM